MPKKRARQFRHEEPVTLSVPEGMETLLGHALISGMSRDVEELDFEEIDSESRPRRRGR